MENESRIWHALTLTEWEDYFRPSKTNQLLINPWSLICNQSAKWQQPTSCAGPKKPTNAHKHLNLGNGAIGILSQVKWPAVVTALRQLQIWFNTDVSQSTSPPVILATFLLPRPDSLPLATCPRPSLFSASPDCHSWSHTCSHLPHLLRSYRVL